MTLGITHRASGGEPADLFDVTAITDQPPPGPHQKQITVYALPDSPRRPSPIGTTPESGAAAGPEDTAAVTGVGPGAGIAAADTPATVLPDPRSWPQRVTVAGDFADPVPDSLTDEAAAHMACSPLAMLLPLLQRQRQHPLRNATDQARPGARRTGDAHGVPDDSAARGLRIDPTGTGIDQADRGAGAMGAGPHPRDRERAHQIRRATGLILDCWPRHYLSSSVLCHCSAMAAASSTFPPVSPGSRLPR